LAFGDVYGSKTARIKGHGAGESRLVKAILMWIPHSACPLKVHELCHVLAIEIGPPGLNTYNVPSIEALLTYCQGLVSVDKETSKVLLIHFTL